MSGNDPSLSLIARSQYAASPFAPHLLCSFSRLSRLAAATTDFLQCATSPPFEASPSRTGASIFFRRSADGKANPPAARSSMAFVDHGVPLPRPQNQCITYPPRRRRPSPRSVQELSYAAQKGARALPTPLLIPADALVTNTKVEVDCWRAKRFFQLTKKNQPSRLVSAMFTR